MLTHVTTEDLLKEIIRRQRAQQLPFVAAFTYPNDNKPNENLARIAFAVPNHEAFAELMMAIAGEFEKYVGELHGVEKKPSDQDYRAFARRCLDEEGQA